jgi:hypothetical protein
MPKGKPNRLVHRGNDIGISILCCECHRPMGKRMFAAVRLVPRRDDARRLLRRAPQRRDAIPQVFSRGTPTGAEDLAELKSLSPVDTSALQASR